MRVVAKIFHFLCLVSIFLCAQFSAHAELVIEITEGIESATPVAVVPFSDSALPVEFRSVLANVIESDLVRSGRFSAIPIEKMLQKPTERAEVDFRDWRLVNAEVLVVGKVTATESGLYNVVFELHDVLREKVLHGARFSGISPANMRRLAHRISDLIYEKLVGIRGVFSTRIAYVTKEKNVYSLEVADADGYNPVTILKANEPILSPAWSPDGKQLAYSAFSKRKIGIYLQNVTTGKRQLITQYQGLNGAPAWSPDGKQLAFVLSKDGNPEIYRYQISNRKLTRLTRHYGIDTEPEWTKDGKQILFTSDRSGKPQIYEMPASGGKAKRLTFEGRYNARARVSPDNEKVAFVFNQGAGYQIAILDRASGAVQVLTDSRLDESPSFSPNGEMIIYTNSVGNRQYLAAVSVDGRVKQRLALASGKVREPAWSPF